jgi:hypothetical protein
MPIVAKLDEYGKGAWIAFAVLGFIIFWPLGLATLVFLFWSGRMGHGCGPARYEHRMNRLQDKMERLRERMGGAQPWGRGGFGGKRAVKVRPALTPSLQHYNKSQLSDRRSGFVS